MDKGDGGNSGSFLFNKQLSVKKIEKGVDIRKLGYKINKERNKQKVDPKTIILSDLRERSIKVRDSKLKNIAGVLKKPDGYELGDEFSLSMNLQRIFERARHNTKHGIAKRDDVGESNIGVIVDAQSVSESLKIVEVDFNGTKKIVWLVCLLNEWIGIGKDDSISLEEVVEYPGFQICRKWKKVI